MADLTPVPEEEDVRLTAINRALDYLLNNDQELKARWWTTKNKVFNGSTPEKTYQENPSLVSQYIISMLEN